MQKFYRSQEVRPAREVKTVVNTPRDDSPERENGEGKKGKDYATLIKDSIENVNPLIKVTDSQFNECISLPTETLNTERVYTN